MVEKKNMEDKQPLSVPYREYGTIEPEEKMLNKERDGCFCFPGWFTEELREVFHLSWSLLLIFLFNFLMTPIALIFCGRLGENELAAVALVGSILEATVVSVATGLTTACDTVFAQSYTSSNKTEYGVYLIKSILIILLFVFPTMALLLNIEPLLLLVGQPECVVKIADEYLMIYCVALIPIFLNTILMQYLRCQDILYPTIVIGGSSCALCALTHYLFVSKLSMGVKGSAYAMIFTHYCTTVILFSYIGFTKVYERTWRGWTRDIFQDWGMFLEMAIAGFFMIGLEWWAWEVGVFAAGLLGVKELGAFAILIQIAITFYTIPGGVGLAVNIRIGQHLGAKNDQGARHAHYVGLFITTMVAIIGCSALAAGSYELGKIFTDDPEVIKIVGDILPLVAGIEFFDSFSCLFGGVVRGCGRQIAGSFVMVVGFYMVALPVGLLLEFYAGWGLIGFFWGLLLGMGVTCLCYIVCILRTNWEMEVHKAQVRSGAARQHKDEETKQFAIEEDKPTTSLLLHPHSSHGSMLPIDPTLQHTHLSCRQLLWRRTTFILFMTSFLALGIVLKKLLNVDLYSSEFPCENSTINPFVVTMSPSFKPVM